MYFLSFSNNNPILQKDCSCYAVPNIFTFCLEFEFLTKHFLRKWRQNVSLKLQSRRVPTSNFVVYVRKEKVFQDIGLKEPHPQCSLYLQLQSKFPCSSTRVKRVTISVVLSWLTLNNINRLERLVSLTKNVTTYSVKNDYLPWYNFLTVRYINNQSFQRNITSILFHC